MLNDQSINKRANLWLILIIIALVVVIIYIFASTVYRLNVANKVNSYIIGVSDPKIYWGDSIYVTNVQIGKVDEIVVHYSDYGFFVSGFTENKCISTFIASKITPFSEETTCNIDGNKYIFPTEPYKNISSKLSQAEINLHVLISNYIKTDGALHKYFNNRTITENYLYERILQNIEQEKTRNNTK